MLEYKQLYFPGIPDLQSNDPYEGARFPRSTGLEIGKIIGAPYNYDLIKGLAEQIYVSSWHSSGYHFIAVWKFYVGQKGGNDQDNLRLSTR